MTSVYANLCTCKAVGESRSRAILDGIAFEVAEETEGKKDRN
jgi:hypothetical protein